MKRKKIVVIGGGTGTFTVLSGLKKFRKKNNLELSAVVSMADDGGSTGVLRDELGVLPPGDIRQCLVALSTSDKLMRELMNYRFDNGTLKGHNFGNLLLSSLEKVTGDFGDAVEKVSEILRCEGKIIPATLKKITLVARLSDGRKISGQKNIHFTNLSKLKKIFLAPNPKANQKAVDTIFDADMIVIGPGDFYSSLVPIFLIDGIRKAIANTKAKKVFVCNLMTKSGHTNSFSVNDFRCEVERYLSTVLDVVIYNNKMPDRDLISRYKREGEEVVPSTEIKSDKKSKTKYVGGDLLSKNIDAPKKGDPIKRNLIRHNPVKLARLILMLVNR